MKMGAGFGRETWASSLRPEDPRGRVTGLLREKELFPSGVFKRAIWERLEALAPWRSDGCRGGFDLMPLAFVRPRKLEVANRLSRDPGNQSFWRDGAT